MAQGLTTYILWGFTALYWPLIRQAGAPGSVGQMKRRVFSQVHGRRSTTSMITTSTSDQSPRLASSSRAPACLMSGQYRAVKPHRMYAVSYTHLTLPTNR